MSRSDHFKPFQHRASGQTFSDNASNNQNLFVVAGNEFKRAFSKQPSNYPDIMLSLDAGPAIAPSENSGQTPSEDDNSDGQKSTWADLLSCLPPGAPSEKFIQVQLPRSTTIDSDDADAMELLENSIKSSIDSDVIRKIATRLVATLFYFDVVSVEDDSTVHGLRTLMSF